MSEDQIDEYYDEELDFCLNIVSYKELESNLYKLLTMQQNEWINVLRYVVPDRENISEKIEAMWFPIPEVNDYSAIVILFLNKESLEMVNAIYYNYAKLVNNDRSSND